MVHFWGSKTKEGTEISKSALGDAPAGDIVVVVGEDRLDFNLVFIGCMMAKSAKRKVHLVHVIEVPRALPLNAPLEQESERANKLLQAAMDIAARVGCEAVAEVVQARDAGSALVEEAKDHNCSLIMIGQVRHGSKHLDMSKTVSYVLANAACRVWLMQDPCPVPALPTQGPARTAAPA
jgi:nucleotide-binding universal stress UspA family protein